MRRSTIGWKTIVSALGSSSSETISARCSSLPTNQDGVRCPGASGSGDLRGVDRDPALAGAFGVVHGEVAFAQEILDLAGVGLADGDADAGRDQQRLAGDVDRRLERGEQPLARRNRARPGGTLQQHTELVAAEARHACLSLRMQAPSRLATCCSTRSPAACPSRSLIGLKSSRSMNMTAACAIAARAAQQRVLDAVEEQGAVGQSRQLVVEGTMAQLLFE